MVQLRPRASRTPASAEAMVDEERLRLGQPGSGAAAEPPLHRDDEAPDELSFARAQAEAREEELRVREAARRDQALLRERRRRREELFTEQKRRKLLPDAVLQQLAAAPPTTTEKPPGTLKEVDFEKKSEGRDKGSNSKKAKIQKVQSVGQTKSYLAVRLKDQDLRDSRQQAAKAFIHNSLYGPGTKRTTVNKFLSLDNKRLPVKKAAVQFLNSTMGTQKQQNAKRFKQRWMARKMRKPYQ